MISILVAFVVGLGASAVIRHIKGQLIIKADDLASYRNDVNSLLGHVWVYGGFTDHAGTFDSHDTVNSARLAHWNTYHRLSARLGKARF